MSGAYAQEIDDRVNQLVQTRIGGAFAQIASLVGGFENRVYANNASGLAGLTTGLVAAAITMKSKVSGLFAVGFSGTVTAPAAGQAAFPATIVVQAATAAAQATLTPTAASATAVGINTPSTSSCSVNTLATGIVYPAALAGIVTQQQQATGNSVAASVLTVPFSVAGIFGLPGVVAGAAPAADTATTGVPVGNFAVYQLAITVSGGLSVQLANLSMYAYELPA